MGSTRKTILKALALGLALPLVSLANDLAGTVWSGPAPWSRKARLTVTFSDATLVWKTREESPTLPYKKKGDVYIVQGKQGIREFSRINEQTLRITLLSNDNTSVLKLIKNAPVKAQPKTSVAASIQPSNGSSQVHPNQIQPAVRQSPSLVGDVSFLAGMNVFDPVAFELAKVPTIPQDGKVDPIHKAHRQQASELRSAADLYLKNMGQIDGELSNSVEKLKKTYRNRLGELAAEKQREGSLQGVKAFRAEWVRAGDPDFKLPEPPSEEVVVPYFRRYAYSILPPIREAKKQRIKLRTQFYGYLGKTQKQLVVDGKIEAATFVERIRTALKEKPSHVAN